MKKCPWCSQEYPDEATTCAVDGTALDSSQLRAGAVPSNKTPSAPEANMMGIISEAGQDYENTPPLLKRAVVTVAVVAIFWIGQVIPIPLVQNTSQNGLGPNFHRSIFTLGLTRSEEHPSE